jgi:hypothetical protein
LLYLFGRSFELLTVFRHTPSLVQTAEADFLKTPASH